VNEWSEETEKVVDILLENQFEEVNVYNFGKQVNVADRDGIIQSFYPTTGTILLHSSNERGNKAKSIRDETFETFLDFISNPIRIKQLFY
jgi:hypothetical protein